MENKMTIDLKSFWIITLFLILNGCYHHHCEKIKNTFDGNKVTIELHPIDTLVRNNIASFSLILKNNSDINISFMPIFIGIWVEYNWICLNPWSFKIKGEKGKPYELPNIIIDPINKNSDEEYDSLYKICKPHDKVEMIFGINMSVLQNENYIWHKLKNENYGQYSIYLEYSDCLCWHEDYLSGKARTNTVTVKYLKEYN
jgi:hypothetical protein